MFTAELILILLAACIILIIYIIKRSSTKTNSNDEAESTIETGASYSEYLEKEILRNESKAQQQNSNKKVASTKKSGSPLPADEKQSQLLELREMFLKTERKSAEHTENENSFWDTLYSGLNDIFAKFQNTNTEINTETQQSYIKTGNSSEKVFYIETQGKKVDGEINRLKDIIFDQDNTLSSLKHALDGVDQHFSEDNVEFNTLKKELAKFEQQLNDSKMCMEVLEMENDRLQSEIVKLETQSAISLGETTGLSSNMNQLKETLTGQEKQIDILNETIDSLKLNANESETLKSTIKSFARNSKEMMGCITILEEENDNLHELIEDLKKQQHSTVTDNDTSSDELSKKVSTLEKEIIKKDVAYAKLQDDYSTMEKEYMSMYKKIHDDDDV